MNFGYSGNLPCSIIVSLLQCTCTPLDLFLNGLWFEFFGLVPCEQGSFDSSFSTLSRKIDKPLLMG